MSAINQPAATTAIDRIAVFRQESAISRFRIGGEWESRGADTNSVIAQTASTN